MSRPFAVVCKKGHDISSPGSRNKAGCSKCGRMRSQVCEAKYGHIKERNWKRHGIINADGTAFTLNDYNRYFQIQGGRCKMCNKHQLDLSRALSADHDHVTGHFRALLCNPCNIAVGQYEANKASAEKYLKIF